MIVCAYACAYVSMCVIHSFICFLYSTKHHFSVQSKEIGNLILAKKCEQNSTSSIRIFKILSANVLTYPIYRSYSWQKPENKHFQRKIIVDGCLTQSENRLRFPYKISHMERYDV